MTRGAICDICKKFYEDDKMHRMSKEVHLFRRHGTREIVHVCSKCMRKGLGLEPIKKN